MKFTTLLLVGLAVGLLALVACNRKSAKNVQQTDQPAPPPVPPAPLIPPPPPVPPTKDPVQVVGYQKTACFGKCPVYQVKFFSDGKVTWYGKMNVERLGLHEAKVEPAVLKGIRDKANELKYWDFEGEYPRGKKVADLPSTITFLRAGDVEKTVVDTHEAPENLKLFERYLEELIGSLDWQSSK